MTDYLPREIAPRLLRALRQLPVFWGQVSTFNIQLSTLKVEGRRTGDEGWNRKERKDRK